MSNELEKYYKEYYNKMGDIAYTGDKNAHTSRFLLFKEWINLHVPKGGKILDIGCGSATFAAQSPDYEWHGIDWDIRHTKDKPIIAIEGNIEQTPYDYEAGTFDAITCSEVLEHCFDPIKMLKEMRRLLKRDGTIFLSTPNHSWLVNVVQGFNNLVYDHRMSHTIEHIRTYTYESHKRNLAEAGLAIEEHIGCDAHYDGIIDPMLRSIWTILNEKYNVSVPMQELALAAGKGNPMAQHTIALRVKKV
jgi:2-polyprenyl-3-methyl-5-hydroxy-6-metoxy-1,4-benzoquinol methylase